MSINLRVTTVDDAESIHAVYEYYVYRSVASFNESNKSIEGHRAFIEETLKTYPHLVAEEDGRFLGFACAEPIRPQSGYRYSVELTIYLHPNTPAGQGVGTLLYAKLLAILKAQGYRLAFGVIGGGNAASLALHRRFGFTEAARFPHCAYKHGEWLDSVWMQKILNDWTQRPPALIPFAEYRKTMTL